MIAPSLSGYGFSDHPRTRAVNVQSIAEVFHQLMTGVLGYSRYGAQGGDWGSAITSRLGEVHGPSLYGIHLNLLFVGGRRDHSSELTAEEISSLVESYNTGAIPDYQMSAFLMAVYFAGMTDREVSSLTDAIVRTGETEPVAEPARS